MINKLLLNVIIKQIGKAIEKNRNVKKIKELEKRIKDLEKKVEDNG